MRAHRARHYAAGRHYIRGRLVDQPRRNRRPHEEPPHGTVARYQWHEDRCRCDACRRANADYTAGRRRRDGSAP